MNQNEQELKNEVIRISGASPIKCMKCGKCSATCPAFEEMKYPPHMFVDMVVKGRIKELLNDESIYHCLSCFACVERCPRGVEPAKVVEAIRVVKLRDAGVTHLTPSQVATIINDEIPQQALVSAYRKFRK